MKKCVKCDLVFALSERFRCLYCDTLLTETNEAGEDSPLRISDPAVVSQLVRDRRLLGQGRMQYLVGCYFKIRTFHFLYSFSRNEFKIGPRFKRCLIQPLSLTSFLTIPWVLFNFIDSFLVRLMYHGYCEHCGWKYKKVWGKFAHDPKECEYCLEYMTVVNDILSGRIAQTEGEFKARALEKIQTGKRSAYHDLCSRRSFYSAVLDIVVIWFSLWLIIYSFIMLVFPSLFVWTFRLGGDSPTLDLR